MDIAALVVAALAVLLIVAQRKRIASLEAYVDEQRRSATIKGADADDAGESVEGLRKLVAMMAAGKPVDASMVKENRLFRQAKPDQVQADLEQGAQLAVIDVRSPQEWAGGHIEGALHIPVDDVQKRLHEVPRDGRKLYVICAGGGRSTAAAGFLANRGFLNVHNVEGGMNGWRGKVVKT
jgi:rhodanese-related sulfurtransferase